MRWKFWKGTDSFARIPVKASMVRALYGFTHGVVRRSVYDGLSEPRRRLMHWRVAQMLEKEPHSPTSIAEIAHHAALAGETATAARASVRRRTILPARLCEQRGARFRAQRDAFRRIHARAGTHKPADRIDGNQSGGTAAQRYRKGCETSGGAFGARVSPGRCGACATRFSSAQLSALGRRRLVECKTALAARRIRGT